MLYSYGLPSNNIKTVLRHFLRKSSAILVVGLLGLSLSMTEANAENNILVIHSYHPELSSTQQQQQAIEQGFAETENSSNVFHEFIDSENDIQPEEKQEFIEHLRNKYRRIPLDLLMTVDDPSLELVLQQHDNLFPKVPVVFLGIECLSQELLDTPWLTGVVENHSVLETAIEATRQTWTDRIVIVNDTSEIEKTELEQIEKLKSLSYKPITVEVVNNLAVEDIEERLGKYPRNVPILMLGRLLENKFQRDLIDPKLDTKILRRRRIFNPIYTDSMVRLGTGVVGGKVFDLNYHALQAVELANKILQGAEPDKVGPILAGKNRWIFDYRQLLRYGIKLDLLPDNSELLYDEPPFYIRYRTAIALIGFILLSGLLTIILLIEKNRRRELANKILQENEQRYKDLAKAGANVFWELDEQLRYSYISGDIKDLCGLTPSQMIGSYPPLLHQDHPNLNVDWEKFKRITTAREPFENFTFGVQDEKGIRIFKINGKTLYDRQGNFLGYRGVKQEITAEQNLYQKIAYQATYDDLTGLLNRREFNEKLKYSVKKARKYQTESVLCYLDLDRFKIVNDTAGHSVGDRLLSELARLLQDQVRKEDTLGRLGGDEFGLLLEGCSLYQAEQICEQLIRTINQYRLKWKTVEFDVGVSIGMVGISGNSMDAAQLLSRADLACYQAKNLGRGRVYIVENNHQELNLQQAQMGHIANVSQAIKEKRFYLVKQPIAPMVDDGKQRRHYELLLRLRDRSGKLIAPEEFIPVAERYGVITIVDRWVLETALDSYARYFGEQQALISINLSGASINDERFTNFAINTIENSSVPGNCLCFEITETAAIAQISRAQKFIAAMKNLGVKFALDDFGSGLSSFTYLKNLPIDYLKIDGSLVKAIASEEYNRAIISSINEVSHLMGIKTIAEFVETDLILEYLGKTSIDYAQGYIISRPMAIAS